MQRLFAFRSAAVVVAAFSFVVGRVSGAAPAVVATVAPAPFPAAEAASHMSLPEGFNATLFAGEPDVVQPIAFTFDDRGRLWVAECYSYPNWSQEGTTGKDRILIFEDTKGNGNFDKRTVFADDLMNLSGLEIGFDEHGAAGVFCCCAPRFIFIPAAGGDGGQTLTDKPSGPPRVILDGWDIKKIAHNVYNGLAWGPDGWLYGLHGIQATSHIGKPGMPDNQRTTVSCGVWRYHPTRGTFEVVCNGGTNPWGLDWDEYGQGFITNCVIAHLWHVIPGAHYQRMYGQDPTPDTYDLMTSCADHLHWAGGAWTDSRGGTGKHSEAGGGHAHVGAMVYLGDNWPAAYRNSLFTCNLHGNRVNNDLLEQKGSGYVAHHGKDFLMANDSWFRGIAIKYGPDGAAFVSDWTDTGECHNAKVVDRSNGRIYKVSYGKTTPVALKLADLAALSDMDLAGLHTHLNDWFPRHARRLLEQRAAMRPIAPAALEQLRQILATSPSVPHRLRALWTLHAVGAAEAPAVAALLDDPAEYIRAWAIQLLVEKGELSDALRGKFTEMAKADPSPVVRLNLASAIQRLAPASRWDVVEALASHADDAADQNLPLMNWYAMAPLPAADPDRAVALIGKVKLAQVRQNLARRVGSIDGAGLARLAKFLGASPSVDAARDVLRGMTDALQGQRHAPMPAGWAAAYPKLAASTDPDVRTVATSLAVLFGDKTALESLRARRGTKLPKPERAARPCGSWC